jgi:hypothetical protein
MTEENGSYEQESTAVEKTELATQDEGEATAGVVQRERANWTFLHVAGGAFHWRDNKEAPWQKGDQVFGVIESHTIYHDPGNKHTGGNIAPRDVVRICISGAAKGGVKIRMMVDASLGTTFTRMYASFVPSLKAGDKIELISWAGTDNSSVSICWINKLEGAKNDVVKIPRTQIPGQDEGNPQAEIEIRGSSLWVEPEVLKPSKKDSSGAPADTPADSPDSQFGFTLSGSWESDAFKSNWGFNISRTQDETVASESKVLKLGELASSLLCGLDDNEEWIAVRAALRGVAKVDPSKITSHGLYPDSAAVVAGTVINMLMRSNEERKDGADVALADFILAVESEIKAVEVEDSEKVKPTSDEYDPFAD